MLIRIELTEENCSVEKIYDEENSDDGLESGPVIPEDTIKFVTSPLLPISLPDYYFSRYSHPALNLSVTIPDNDLEIVSGWMGNYVGQASDTLVKRMTNGVIGAIKNYYTYASDKGVYTRPFKIGAAFRMTDGSVIICRKPVVMMPATMSPIMVLHEIKLNGNTLETVTEIINTPVKLSVDISKFDIPRLKDKEAVQLVIFSTAQTQVLSGQEEVTSIRNAEIFGDRVPIWNYNRLSEDVILQNTEQASSFRIIAEIPVHLASEGLKGLALPSVSSSLNDWNSYPRFEWPTGENVGKDPAELKILTVPFNLYRPEEYKKIRGVTIRGIFERNHTDKELSFKLFGSMHRDRWYFIAGARGAHMRFIRTVSYRWYRLEIMAPYPSRIEAITFDIQKK